LIASCSVLESERKDTGHFQTFKMFQVRCAHSGSWRAANQPNCTKDDEALRTCFCACKLRLLSLTHSFRLGAHV
jgi:hypothetical protein